MDKPFRLLAGKDDTVAFNCSSFARQAILNASGKDVDGNRGAIVFPNDILSSPLFDAPGDRVRF
ncbi:MAG TPA: hypothetical protein PLK12_05855 [Prolixibacteraceae bacterium]|nr:hypothetical protein [Prolixibacteraceae bacterium]